MADDFEAQIKKWAEERSKYYEDAREDYEVGDSVEVNYLGRSQGINEATKYFLAVYAETQQRSAECLRQHKQQLQDLLKEFPSLILGEPAIFPYVQTEFDKGYSKGFYEAADEVHKWLKKLRKLVEGLEHG